jgi:hypothetical protein
VAAAPDRAAAIGRAQSHARQDAAALHLSDDQAVIARDVVFDEDGTETGLFLGVSLPGRKAQ